ITGAPMRNFKGEIVGAVAIAHDTTERRRLERHTHAVLDALLEMAEALVETSDETSQKEEQTTPVNEVAKRMAELTCRVLNCSRVGVTAIEPETELLTPVAVVGLSPEQTEQWWK